MTTCCRAGFDPVPAHGTDGDVADAATGDGAHGDAPPDGSGLADSGPAPRRVFVTVESYTGAAGTLTTLDAACQTDATAAGLAGTFKVVLATAGVDPATRLALGTTRSIVRAPDGVTIATDATFFSTGHQAPLSVDVSGATIALVTLAWTDFTPAGIAQTNDCTTWTDNTSAGLGGTGNLLAIDSTWADAGAARCNKVARLICLEQ